MNAPGPASREHELPNVLRLYEELGVHPEDGLAVLTARYRQRVRALHPDRHGGAAGGELGWLTRSYRDAVAFERRHGRLPGAASPGAGAAAAGDPGWASASAAPRRGRARHGGTHWRWLLAGVLLGALLFGVASELSQRLMLDGQPMQALATVRVGSTPAEVLRIAGPPYERRGRRWHYGASWIEFADGRVVAWHSDRSHPLQVDQADMPAALPE